MPYYPPSAGGGAVLPFKSYAAVLNQSGASAPVATVAYNNLGGAVGFSYNGAGEYVASSVGLFTSGKVVVFIGNKNADIENDIVFSITAQISDSSAIVIKAAILQAADVTFSDGLFGDTPIEIRVYT